MPNLHLTAEPLIIDRLKVTMPTLRGVFGMADLASVQLSQQINPAAFVVYDGDVVGVAAGQGAVQMVSERWLVVVSVMNVRDIRGGTSARVEAGVLIGEVIAALAGWQPSPAHRPMTRIAAPKPIFNAGFLSIPLAFDVKFISGV